MEYEKSPTGSTTTFSRKMTNRSNLSFSVNAIYDGVLSSPTNLKSPLVDYSEIFRVSSNPSPSSIPFLDVPELNNDKIKVDVRSSKLDYSSVFGGFGGCDFAVTSSRNRRKEENKQTSSPEMVRMKHSDVSHHQTTQVLTKSVPSTIQMVDKMSQLQRNEVKPPVIESVEKVSKPGPTKLVDNISSLQKIETNEANISVEKKTSNEEVKASKTEVEFGNIFGRNGYSTRENFTCKTDSNVEYRDVKPPISLQRGSDGGNGVCESEDDEDSPSSPVYFDAETDENLVAVESSAVLKKALDEAQVRMNIAKQMMERKKSGFRSSVKPKSCDELKVGKKVEEVREETSRDNNNSQIIDEIAKSEQPLPEESVDQHAKRARKVWQVPEGLLKPILGHKKEEEEDAVKLEEEKATRGRKQWELPGVIFKSVMNSKQPEPENLSPPKPETDMKQEVQPSTENPFYTFGQLGSKIKCVVVEAFTGSKKDEKHVSEKESATVTQIVQGGESEIVAGIPVMEVEEIPQHTENKSETEVEEKSETTVCDFTEDSSQNTVNSAHEAEALAGEGDSPPDPTYNVLNQDNEEETVSEPQEMFGGPDDSTQTYMREVEEIPTSSQSQFDESVGTIVSFHKETGNINEVKETVQKTPPRRRKVWKTSEDVYNMIKALPKVDNTSWQLESVENETTESVKIYDVSEETGSVSGQQASDSGLQENWTVLKQMFRQMFQTTESKGEEETHCLLEPEKDHIDIHQRAEDENGKETAETGSDRYEQDEVEAVRRDYEARGNESLESPQESCSTRKEEPLVHELIEEELKAIGMASDQEGEVSEEAIWAQGLSQLNHTEEHANSHAEMLKYDRTETDSNESVEKFEQTEEVVEETKTDCSVEDTDTSRSSFEMRQTDSYVEEEYDGLGDQFHEKASSTEEHVEEIDSDSVRSGWSAVDDEGASQSSSKPEETKEETDETETSLGIENNEDKTEQEHQFECPENECLPNRDETDRNMEDNNVEEKSRSSIEEGGTASDASLVEKYLREKERLKEKEKVMVERAIREARERAFADAKERAGKAAMEKEKAKSRGPHKRVTSEIPRRPGEVNDKSSSSAAMQAKLRAERAAVERALSEARERAMEKALSSGKSAQTRSYGGSKSFNEKPAPSTSDRTKAEPLQRGRARSERHQRTSDRAAEALAEKKLRDLKAQKEQTERNRLSESLDADVKRWSSGKENNLRALLSTLQYILGTESGWKPIPLTDLVSSASVRKAYRKATLCVHPDKLQQRGASTQQKYICEKVFDLLKEAWNKFGADER